MCSIRLEDAPQPINFEVIRKSQTTIQYVAKRFHLPIVVAGQDMGICPTLLKRICRQNGIARWPYRQLRRIAGAVHKLEQLIQEHDDQAPTYNVLALELRVAALKDQMASITLYQVNAICLE